MKADKALELVGKYARLTRAISACKPRIGACLDKCAGATGKRLLLDEYGCNQYPNDEDQETHLKGWYSDYTYDYQDDPHWVGIGADQLAECEHCWAAHQVIKERRELRRQLAGVKGAMTRSGSAPVRKAKQAEEVAA